MAMLAMMGVMAMIDSLGVCVGWGGDGCGNCRGGSVVIWYVWAA
mgnify:CR=1 FL=1